MNTESSSSPNEASGVPNLPPIPKSVTTPAVPTPQTVAPALKTLPKTTEDPTWWRKGAIPFIVLLLAAAAADLYWPRVGGIGVGAGIAGILLTSGILLLRKDLSKGEICFLAGLACINCTALLVSGNILNYFIGILAPFFLLAIPTPKGEPITVNVEYRSWWGYWTARRPKQEKEKKTHVLRKVLPTFISVLVSVALFIAFLSIFASGNPVVEQVWQWIVSRWNELVIYLNISWDFAYHLIYWAVGILVFGIYAHKRPFAPLPVNQPIKPLQGTTLLPQLPLYSLVGINAAFLVATSTDIAYLWFKNIPEGITQTAYLHDGADSITWAAILAALVLIFLFRRNGIARQSVGAKLAGYLLVIQTFLLAASVYLRLYYQICDYGFTTRRILAGEFLLLGLAGLVILVFYMACEGNFRKFAKICMGCMLLMVIAGGIITPSRLAADLNMCFMSSNPHWEFEQRDFSYGRFSETSNLHFAEIIYRRSPNRRMAGNLISAAEDIIAKEQIGGWTSFTLNHYYDLPAAERILEDPSIRMMADGIDDEGLFRAN